MKYNNGDKVRIKNPEIVYILPIENGKIGYVVGQDERSYFVQTVHSINNNTNGVGYWYVRKDKVDSLLEPCIEVTKTKMIGSQR